MNDIAVGRAFVASTDDGAGAIHRYTVDLNDTGYPEHAEETPASEDASYLSFHPNGRVLYAVGDTDGGTVHAFGVDPETGRLSPLGSRSTGSKGPCYCSVNPGGDYLLVAHYQGGAISTLPIGCDGGIDGSANVFKHDGNDPHPHAIVPHPECERVYVPDLGTDEVVQYDLDRATGQLNQVGSLSSHDGAGPRHFVFHPEFDLAYLVNERNSTLTSLSCPPTGELGHLQTVDTLPDSYDGENHPADVHVHPNGQYVYASNRGHDSIGIFRADEDGSLNIVGHETTRGEWPRDFVIAPNGRFLYVENKDTDTIVVFAVDEGTGTLNPTGTTLELLAPTCMKFHDAATSQTT